MIVNFVGVTCFFFMYSGMLPLRCFAALPSFDSGLIMDSNSKLSWFFADLFVSCEGRLFVMFPKWIFLGGFGFGGDGNLATCLGTRTPALVRSSLAL